MRPYQLQIRGIALENQKGKTFKIMKATADKKKKILFIKTQNPVEPGAF